MREGTVKSWEGVRVVHMPRKPRRSEVVYGVTRSMLARMGGLSAKEAEALPMHRIEDALLTVARAIDRDRRAGRPCKAPRSPAMPPLDGFWSTFTLVYSPALEDTGSIPDRPPTQAELQHCAAQLAAFKTPVKVVGNHLRIGHDYYTLWDGRRLLVMCHSFKKPARRKLFIKMLSALAS